MKKIDRFICGKIESFCVQTVFYFFWFFLKLFMPFIGTCKNLAEERSLNQ